MSGALPGGDVRGFYAALGVELPGWAHTEAPVRCFADPDAHAHRDRDASCSVNLHSGAFNCHGCGAHGGAYDAALASGLDSRQAFELKVAYGLAERERPRREQARASSPGSMSDPSSRGPMSRKGAAGTRSRPPAPSTHTPSPPRTPSPAAPTAGPRAASEEAVTPGEVRAWALALAGEEALLARLRGERGWDGEVLRRLGVGFDGERITVPIADEEHRLQGVLRLRVDVWQKPKVLAVPGTRLGLIPHPSTQSGGILLVEGASDMLAARSAGLNAVGVPGTHAWRAEWARAFSCREVMIVMDADRPGREAAARIARDLEGRGCCVQIFDLAPHRDDGYDLSDWLEGGNRPQLLSAGWFKSELYTRLATPGGDVWTLRSARTDRTDATRAQPARGVSGAVTQPGAMRGAGWRA